MGEKKSIIKQLKGYFDKDFRKKLKKEESLRGLLEQLEAKEAKLACKLGDEERESKRELLQTKLEVLRAQIAKARRLLEEGEAEE